MSRIPRQFLNSQFFHVIVQGIRKEYIFEQDEDIKKYLYLLKQKINVSSIKIIAYYIMHNHAHILLYTNSIQELSSVMRSLNTAYALYYNKKKNTVGYVFRNRFVSEPIYNERYLLNCIAYIHNNPVKAKIVSHPSRYRYSSYYDYTHKTGIINDTILQLVFSNNLDYLAQFLSIHNSNSMDFKEISNEFVDYKIVLQQHNHRFPYNLEKMIINKDWRNKEYQELFKNLITDLKEKSGLSLRSIQKILNIDRRTLSNLLK